MQTHWIGDERNALMHLRWACISSGVKRRISAGMVQIWRRHTWAVSLIWDEISCSCVVGIAGLGMRYHWPWSPGNLGRTTDSRQLCVSFSLREIKSNHRFNLQSMSCFSAVSQLLNNLEKYLTRQKAKKKKKPYILLILINSLHIGFDSMKQCIKRVSSWKVFMHCG